MAQSSVKAVPLVVFDSATVTGTFQVIDPDGFIAACFLICITNESNMPILISFDGVTSHEYIPANTVKELPVQTNAQPNSNTALWSKYSKVYVKGATGVGFITLSGYYV